jgi:hypothetical protein
MVDWVAVDELAWELTDSVNLDCDLTSSAVCEMTVQENVRDVLTAFILEADGE